MLCRIFLKTLGSGGGGGGSGGDGEGGTWGAIVGSVFSVLFLGCCVWQCCLAPYLYKPDNSKTTCYLCLVEIPNAQWDDGSHRRRCAANFARTLNAMAKSDTESCPKCGDKLRKWPKQGPEVRIMPISLNPFSKIHLF